MELLASQSAKMTPRWTLLLTYAAFILLLAVYAPGVAIAAAAGMWIAYGLGKQEGRRQQ